MRGALIIILGAMIISYFNNVSKRYYSFEISGGLKVLLVLAIFYIYNANW